ncbi:hypothetical protein [Nocardia asteroides]|uniref:hypothetical protein n=1 Tax=Nocardia asteroides TaxID=1824 RepID=UPI003435208B
MTAALLAACAAVLGIVIGRLWDHRSETTRWRRDKRADSYLQLAAAFRTSYDTIAQIALSDTSAEHIVATDNHVWHNALSSVWIYGSPEAAVAAAHLDRTLTQLYEDSTSRRHCTSDWVTARVPARRAFEIFLAAVRAEVSHQAVPTVFYEDSTPIEQQ